MKKDAFYFPHFSNARNDSKLIKLRRVFGIEGYGIYFMLLEVLREQTGFKYPLSGIDDLTYEWHTSKEKIISVINDFDLFEIDNTNLFFSTKLVLYLQPYLEKSQRARDAANKRWDEVNNTMHANAYAKALPVHNKSNTNANASKVKESKVKESKVNNILCFDFYQNQISLNAENDNITLYSKFVDILHGKNDLNRELKELLSIENQVTFEQFNKLMEKSKQSGKKFSKILPSMTNDPKYYKRKKSLYLTINNWLNSDYK